MSYARMGLDGSQVYVFMNVSGHLTCCLCCLRPNEPSFNADSTAAMVDHLREHTEIGHHVPGYLVPDLWADNAENFPREA